MAIHSVYPIYDQNSYVSKNSFNSFKMLAPEDLMFADSPEDADLQIVFETVHNSLTQRLGLKKILQRNLVVLAEADKYNFPIVPGLYVSLTSNWAKPGRASSHAYISYLAETDGNPYCKGFVDTPKEYVCCFSGKSNIQVRKRIFAVLQNQPGFFMKDTRDSYKHFSSNRDQSEQESYVGVIRASEFSICPRGRGASSIRLFESMRLGTAPIIIGDAWVPPVGPDWESFSFRVQESEIDTIPELVKANRHRHKEMGLLARRAYETHFSPQTMVPDMLRQFEVLCQHSFLERARRIKGYLHHTVLHSLRYSKYILSRMLGKV